MVGRIAGDLEMLTAAYERGQREAMLFESVEPLCDGGLEGIVGSGGAIGRMTFGWPPRPPAPTVLTNAYTMAN
jgi:hypothetical protein